MLKQARFSLLDKRLFEISKVVIMRVDSSTMLEIPCLDSLMQNVSKKISADCLQG